MRIPVHGLSNPEGGIDVAVSHGNGKDIIVGDSHDFPVLGSHGGNLPDFCLPDIFFIQFADPGLGVMVAELVIAPVGDGSAGGIKGQESPFFPLDRMIQPVDGNSRPEFPDSCIGISPGQHIQYEIIAFPAEIVIGPARFQESIQFIHIPGFKPGHGNNNLGQDIQGAVNGMDRFDILCIHGLCQDRGSDQIMGMGRKKGALADPFNMVPGPSDSLYGRRHGGRSLDQDDLGKFADIDPHFKGACGHNGSESSVFQILFYIEPELS